LSTAQLLERCRVLHIHLAPRLGRAQNSGRPMRDLSPNEAFRRYLRLAEVQRMLSAMSKQRLRLSDQIRLSVDACGLSRYRISKQLGIAESTLSRFMSGQGGLSMEYLDRLAELLDLRIKAGARRRKRG
jgi:hypothetical protein